MFDWLVHSKTRLRMLKMFFKDLEKPLYGLEIAQALKASPGTTHRELNAMLKKGVIKKKKEGALVLYTMNQSHPYFHEIKKAVFPKKRKGERLLFVSDLHLSVHSTEDVIEDLYYLLTYAEEEATELIFLGDTLEMLKGDVFQTFLYHKPLFERLIEASHQVKISYVMGNHDCFLEPLVEGKFFETKIHFLNEYSHEKLGVFAMHGHQFDDISAVSSSKKVLPKRWQHFQDMLLDHEEHQQLAGLVDHAQKAAYYAEMTSSKKANMSTHLQKVANEFLEEHDYDYLVMGHSHKALLESTGHGVYLNTGSWDSEKKHQFAEIDKEGAALIDMKDLKA